jgi:hypothetical protein
MMNFFDKLSSVFSKSYDELTIFLTALACFLVALTHPDIGSMWLTILDSPFWFLAFFSILGLSAAIYHAFSSRKKSVFDATIMCVFVMIVNGITGVAAGISMLSGPPSIAWIFPVWNILTSGFLIYEIGFVKFTLEESDASIWHVAIGSMIVLIMYVIAEVKLRGDWHFELSLLLFVVSNTPIIVSPILALQQPKLAQHSVARKKRPTKRAADASPRVARKQKL